MRKLLVRESYGQGPRLVSSYQRQGRLDIDQERQPPRSPYYRVKEPLEVSVI
jgi:hypothetical protein